MSDVVPCKTPAEYFKGQVEAALAKQHVRADELTSYYLVDLLCRFVRPEERIRFYEKSEEPIALRLGKALGSGGLEQWSRLRNVGDISLFMSGFFSDSFHRRLVDVDYYVSLGQFAYASLAQREAHNLTSVFTQLASKFVAFTDVLAEISERECKPLDILRLYEKWLRTGSKRAADRLKDRGIVPNVSIGSKFIQ